MGWYPQGWAHTWDYHGLSPACRYDGRSGSLPGPPASSGGGPMGPGVPLKARKGKKQVGISGWVMSLFVVVYGLVALARLRSAHGSWLLLRVNLVS